MNSFRGLVDSMERFTSSFKHMKQHISDRATIETKSSMILQLDQIKPGDLEPTVNRIQAYNDSASRILKSVG